MTAVRNVIGMLAITCVAALCVACGSKRVTYELVGATMGTTFDVQIVSDKGGVDTDVLKDEIQATLNTIESSMSTYLPDSELSRFNALTTSDWFAVSAEFCAVIEDAKALSRLSAGAFDVTIGPLVNLWGFGPDGSISAPPVAERIAELMRAVGNDKLHVDCSRPAVRKDDDRLQVDLSAYAKGYGVDQVAGVLDSHGIANYLVEIGGEVRARGSNGRGVSWSIGIEAPQRGSRSVARIVRLHDAAMATSGDYRTYFESAGSFYSHTIDPRTGYPVSHNAAAVTVVADTTAFADGMATALLVLGPDEGLKLAEQQDIAALFQLRLDNAIDERMSARFARELAAE